MGKKKNLKDKDKEIDSFLKSAGRQYKKNILLDCILVSFSIGLGFGAILNLSAVFWPIYYALPTAAAIAAASPLLGALYGVFRFPNRKETAYMTDQCGLQERLTTSVELQGKEDILSSLQKEDTLKALEDFPVRDRIPVRVAAGRVLTLVLLMLSFFIPVLVPSPAKKEAGEGHALKQEVRKEAEKIQQVKKEFTKMETIDPLKKALLEKMMEEALLELKNIDSKEELGKAEERLNKKMEQLAKNFSKEELKMLADSLSKGMELNFSKEELEQLAQQLTKEEFSMLEGMELSGEMQQEGQKQELKEGSQGSEEKGNGEGGQSGEGNGEGEGTGEGEGEGNGEGEGAGSGEGNGQGQGSQGKGGGQNYGSKNGLEREGVKRKEPEKVMLESGVGEDENLTGKKNSGGTSYKAKGKDGVTWSGNQVDYDQVVGAYVEEAYSKVSQDKVPEPMKEIVKSYFDGLNQ